MAFCSGCGTQMADNVAFCPKCGKAAGQAAGQAAAPTAGPAPQAAPPVTGYNAAANPSTPLEENIAGMLAYFTIIPAIVFLLIEPYNRNTFVRFHSFQCLFTFVAIIVIQVALVLLSAILHAIPVVGAIVAGVLWFLLWLGSVALWLLLVIKAYKHEIYKLPYVGDMAAKQAGIQ